MLTTIVCEESCVNNPSEKLATIGNRATRLSVCSEGMSVALSHASCSATSEICCAPATTVITQELDVTVRAVSFESALLTKLSAFDQFLHQLTIMMGQDGAYQYSQVIGLTTIRGDIHSLRAMSVACNL